MDGKKITTLPIFFLGTCFNGLSLMDLVFFYYQIKIFFVEDKEAVLG